MAITPTLETIEEELKGVTTGVEEVQTGINELETDIISSEDIQPTGDIGFTEPIEVPAFDVSSLDFELTPAQEKEQGVSEEIQALNLALVGETAFRTGLEREGDLPGLEATQRDLASQLKILQNEAKSIPLQTQQEAEGRGITAAGLRPKTIGRLRENAIKALTISALLDAANGQIVTAQTKIDRAVAQKFDPIRAEIDAKTRNLRLIQDSPESTQAEKKRAAEQEAILTNQKTEIERQEAEQKEIWNIAVDVAGKVDAITLQKIQNAQTREEALQIAQESGALTEEEKPDLLSVAEAKSLGVPFGTTKAEAAQRGITPGGGEPTPKEVSFKFSTSQTSKLVASGFTTEDLTNIQKDINEFGLEATLNRMAETDNPFTSGIGPLRDIPVSNKIKALRDIFGGSTSKTSDSGLPGFNDF